jgi:hypothetical protein
VDAVIASCGEQDGDASSCAVLAWARSGAMALTGWPDGPPLVPPFPVMTRLVALAASLREASAHAGRAVVVDAGDVVTARAAALGLTRRGRVSCGGATRLLFARDGWLALSLARPSDIEAVPAIIGEPAGAEPWAALERAASLSTAGALVDQAQLLGVAAAILPEMSPTMAPPPYRIERKGPEHRRPVVDALVVDLSSLWAGPLCASILHRAGAQVVTVESAGRPDGARAHPAFYSSLHRGHDHATFDFTSATGVDGLRALLARADVVIESSRPRALAQLGIDFAEHVARGTTWVSITGYGRESPYSNRVAFGDDAAVAAGLVAFDHAGAPVFCADAIADPAAGLAAAAGALTALLNGGGCLVDVALRDAAAFLADPGAPPCEHPVRPGARAGSWQVAHGATWVDVVAP